MRSSREPRRAIGCTSRGGRGDEERDDCVSVSVLSAMFTTFSHRLRRVMATACSHGCIPGACGEASEELLVGAYSDDDWVVARGEVADEGLSDAMADGGSDTEDDDDAESAAAATDEEMVILVVLE